MIILGSSIMTSDSRKVIRYNSDIVQRIFENKKSSHQKRARMPIEKKIKILIELQKIVLETRQTVDPLDNKRVWRL